MGPESADERTDIVWKMSMESVGNDIEIANDSRPDNDSWIDSLFPV